jgi:hypothetical protein
MAQSTPDDAWVQMPVSIGFVRAGGDPERFSHPDSPGLAATFDHSTGELRLSRKLALGNDARERGGGKGPCDRCLWT